MKIEEMIEGYEKAVAEQEATVKLEQEKTLTDAKTAFEESVRKVLADLWNELLPQGTEFSDKKNESSIKFYIRISFDKWQGCIRQDFNKNRKTWDDMYMDFGYWGGEAMSVELPADPAQLGRLFSKVKKAIVEKTKSDLVTRERDLEILLDFSHLNEYGVANRLEDALKRFPEHEEKFKANAEAQLKVIEQEAEKKIIEQLAYDLEQSERQQLGLLAEFAWRGPFIVYKIFYGAGLEKDEDGENYYYTNHFYTLSETPDEKGYWTAFEDGNYKRRVKPENIISTDEVTIQGNNVPNDLRRWITLESKVVKDCSIATFIPPIELFAFDYEALSVAVEAEQDAELANATQEDLS